MKITARYKRLSLWNKVGFWGAAASILGIIIAGVIFLVAQHLGPTKANQEEIKKDLAQIVEMLREELSIKNKQIEFLQGEITGLRDITPSDRASQLAEQIPEDAGPYALALKAIAEKRFDDARRLLDKAQEQKETELAEIYRTRGETELYAGNYIDSATWYDKALELEPDNRKMLEGGGVAFLLNEKYEKAEVLMRRALETGEKAFGQNDPRISRYLNNLALLLYETNRAGQAESLMRRALAIDEKALGKDHAMVAIRLNNLAWLLKRTDRLCEVEALLRRALDISENVFGKDHAKVAIPLNNLGVLLREMNRLVEAEPFMRRGLEIDEKSLGKDHPLVAAELNDLAELLAATNRIREAEALMHRAIAIDEKSFGKDHPNVAIRLNNLAVLLQVAKLLVEAEPFMRRALAIDERAFGKDHTRIAAELNDLAVLLVATNRSGEAEPLYRRALGIFEASMGADHPNTQTVRRNLEGLK